MKQLIIASILSVMMCSLSILSLETTYAANPCDGVESIDRVNCVLNDIKPGNAPDPLGIETRAATENQGFVDQTRWLVSIVTGAIASFAGIFALIMLLKHSFMFITSDGDTGKMTEAGKGILMSLGGVVAIILSYSIVYTIITVLYEQLAK